MGTDRNIVDICPLAPMQRLYFAVSELDRDITLVQLRYLLSGDLDAAALTRAWRYIVARHSILRTGFVSQDVDEPLQVVFADCTPGVEVEDLRGMAEEECKRRIQEYCESDRALGFNPEEPPLMRVRLFRTGDRLHLMVWSYERILLDGWSLGLLMQELSVAYEAAVKNRTPALEPAPPYRDFIAWLDARDFTGDVEYWRQTLAGYRTPAALAHSGSIATPRKYRRHTARLGTAATQALQTVARTNKLTVNTMVQAAWAILLNGYTGLDDVVFGCSVAGRPSDLPGVELIAGLFTNTVPMRIRVNPSETLLSLLRRVQLRHIEMSSHEQTPVPRIREAAELPVHQRLFETLVVYQSHAGATPVRFGDLVEIKDLNEALPNNYAATLMAVPGEALALSLSVDSGAIEAEVAESIVHDVAGMLECMSASVACTTADLVRRVRRIPAGTAEPDRSRSAEVVAARDTLELQMVGIFQQAFGRAEIGATDNFFALGGHSLLAVWLFERIERTFGKKLPLPTLLHSATPQALANVLRQDNWSPSWSSLVPINPGGSRLPFFSIHGGGGNVLFYRDLSAHLGPNQPFYALQPQGMDGKLPTHMSVEEMADHYIAEIRQLQPRGPYRIGGASFGGMVAFEMARRLRQHGHEVGLVALFDTHGPGYPQFRPGITRWHKMFFRHWERVDYHARNLFLLDNRGRIDYIRQKMAKAKHMLRLAVKRSRKSLVRMWHEARGYRLPASLVRTQNAILHALVSYKPPYYDGEITVFRATRQPRGVVPNATLGWAGYAKSVRVIDVPGYHTGIILEPHVRFMAEKLRASFDAEPGVPAGATTGNKERVHTLADAAIA